MHINIYFIVCFRSRISAVENSEDVSSPVVSALMADFDIDAILTPDEDSARSSATERNNDTSRGGDAVSSRWQQNVKSGLEMKLSK